MKKFILALVASVAVFASVLPSLVLASEHVNCDSVPRAQWAQCILDQAADQSSQ